MIGIKQDVKGHAVVPGSSPAEVRAALLVVRAGVIMVLAGCHNTDTGVGGRTAPRHWKRYYLRGAWYMVSCK